MAAVPVTLDGVLYDLYNRTTQRVVLMADASLSGVGIGGGPVYPVAPPVGGGPPPHPVFPIWGPPGISLPPIAGYPPVAGHPLPPLPGYPSFPIWGPPGIEFPPIAGYPPVVGGGPIIPTPPDWKPPVDVPPGSVVKPPGPPEPVNPIVPPNFILVNYPGVGWVIVGKPVMPSK